MTQGSEKRKIKVAINGMGRIGRLVFRSLWNADDFEIVAVNDIADAKSIAYLLAHSTEYGAFQTQILLEDNCLVLGEMRVPVYQEASAENLPWNALDVDIVLECSGVYSSREKADAHLKAGAKKVLISSAAGADVPTVVYGVNEDILTADDLVVSAASCSTVGLAPFAQALNKAFPIRKAIATTIHALTPSQMVLDDPQKKGNLRRSRTASENIIPTSAAFASAVGLVLPELAGKLDGYAIRVPVTRGSLITLYAVVEADYLDADSLNAAMQARANNIFGYTEEELVSSDIAGTNYYSIFDATQTRVSMLGERSYLIEVAAWFDNETSYISAYLNLARHLVAS